MAHMSTSFEKRYHASWHNQYSLPLGCGYSDDRQEAIDQATRKADAQLRSANPNWKWRKAKLKVKDTQTPTQA